jgi:hypothetical protein
MSAQNNSGYVGWAYFASMMMLVLGGLQAMAGLVALFKDDYYVVTSNHLVAFDYSTWGWINIVVGVIIFFAGLSLASGKMWGRVVGSWIVVANAISNIAFFPAYPVWCTIALVIDGLVLYSLTVKGSEIKEG